VKFLSVSERRGIWKSGKEDMIGQIKEDVANYTLEIRIVVLCVMTPRGYRGFRVRVKKFIFHKE
jgi:hypothetical protein